MNNDKGIAGDGVILGREHWDVPVRVELRSYLHFSRRLDAQLRRLVVRWAHAASPSARGALTVRERTGTSAFTIP